MRSYLLTLSFILFSLLTKAQTLEAIADSIRQVYRIPELAFAVISSDSVLVMQISGVQRISSRYTAKRDDRFHIGSNTKAITSFLAALLVEKKEMTWNTKFLDVFPELKSRSRREYQNITLQDLLTFRGKLPAYTYTFAAPTRKQIRGNEDEQRYRLASYFLSQPPMQSEDGFTPSNADYILAGLMLEKKSGKSFKALVTEFGESLGIRFGFDYPNLTDTLQPWGHDASLKPVAPFDNYKLNWLLAAGNINVSLPDYCKFIQLQLTGLQGKSKFLSPQTFDTLLYGLAIFSFGWFNKTDSVSHHTLAYNEGNAGAFITRTEIDKEAGKAYIIFTNAATDETEQGIAALMQVLQARFRTL